MTDIGEWQGGVGRSWAGEQARTDRSFSRMTPHLLAAIDEEPGRYVVDIGCGAGELSLALARGRPDAMVTGVDVSADLVAAASARAAGLDNVRFAVADASTWQPEQAPDLYVSRHGVMFFPEPPAAFAHLAAIAAPGARIVFSCFRTPRENRWASGIASLLPESGASASAPPPTSADPFAPGPFAFADPDHVRTCLRGWRDVTFTPVDFDYIAGAGPDAVAEALAFFGRIGPAARAIRVMSEAERPAFLERLANLLESHRSGDVVSFPAAVWLVRATAE